MLACDIVALIVYLLFIEKYILADEILSSLILPQYANLDVTSGGCGEIEC